MSTLTRGHSSLGPFLLSQHSSEFFARLPTPSRLATGVLPCTGLYWGLCLVGEPHTLFPSCSPLLERAWTPEASQDPRPGRMVVPLFLAKAGLDPGSPK